MLDRYRRTFLNSRFTDHHSQCATPWILFSYSFFFEGLTGLTITIGAIVTLALLMITTARVNWAEKFTSPPTIRGIPPPVPQT